MQQFIMLKETDKDSGGNSNNTDVLYWVVSNPFCAKNNYFDIAGI